MPIIPSEWSEAPMRDGRLCCHGGVLALAKEVVGVTLGISCMIPNVPHVPGLDGGVMAPLLQV